MIREEPKVQPLVLQPTFDSRLSWLDPRDYFVLFYWYWYFPQAIDDYLAWAASEAGQPNDGLSAEPVTEQNMKDVLLSTSEPLFWHSAILGQLSLWFAFILYSVAERLVRGATGEAWNFGVGFAVGTIFYLGCIATGFVLAKARLAISPYYLIVRQVYYLVAFTFLLSLPWLSPATIVNRVTVSLYIGCAIGLILGLTHKTLVELDEFTDLALVIRVFLGVAVVLVMSFLARFIIATNEIFIARPVDFVLELILFASTVVVTWGFIFFRPDDWIFGYLFGDRKPDEHGYWEVPHVTRLPLLRVTNTLTNHFQDDWKVALKNALLLRRYSRQDAYIVHLIRSEFTETEEKKGDEKAQAKIIENALLLFQDPSSRRDVLKFAPDSDGGFKETDGGKYTKNLSDVWKRLNESKGSKSNRSPILDTSKDPTAPKTSYKLGCDSVENELVGRAAIAGFWYLMCKQPQKAKGAFKKIQTAGDIGKELFAITTILDEILEPVYKVIPDAPLDLQEKTRPRERKFKEAWGALDEIREFVRCGWVFQRCNETDRRITIGGIAVNHIENAREKLEEIVKSDQFAPIERLLFAQAEYWQGGIDRYHAPNIKKLKKSDHPNPFKFMEPLRGNQGEAYQKRSSVADIFESAWVPGNFQPVLVYGQRQIGKTSVVLIEGGTKPEERIIIHVNMQHLDTHAMHAHLFIAICDEIERKMNGTGRRPEDVTLLRTPYYSFRKYINGVGSAYSAIVIAIDEFEHIESLAAYTDTHDNILSFLWELAQAESHLGFVFITHKTPFEILNEYNNPFATGLNPICISYLADENTKKLLRNPTKEFLPYCTDEAIGIIHKKTNGHPFLAQLWGYCLIENFRNNIKNDCDPLFTESEVREVEEENETFKRGLEHYATNIWLEVAKNDTACALVLYQLSREDYIEYPRRDKLTHIKDNQRALEHLKNHDVIIEDLEMKTWQITVPLLRDWCTQKLKSDGSLPDFTFRDSNLP